MGEPKTSKHRSEERSNRKEGVERGKRPMVQSSAPFGKGWETRAKPEGMREGSRRAADDLEIQGDMSMNQSIDLDGKNDRWFCTVSIQT